MNTHTSFCTHIQYTPVIICVYTHTHASQHCLGWHTHTKQSREYSAAKACSSVLFQPYSHHKVPYFSLSSSSFSSTSSSSSPPPPLPPPPPPTPPPLPTPPPQPSPHPPPPPPPVICKVVCVCCQYSSGQPIWPLSSQYSSGPYPANIALAPIQPI